MSWAFAIAGPRRRDQATAERAARREQSDLVGDFFVA
jgi:hypothetical protein